jgi:hypothetical protein
MSRPLPTHIRDLDLQAVAAWVARLGDQAEAAWEEVQRARQENRPLPWVSIPGGEDMSYVVERARRWNELLTEMRERNVESVRALGADRADHWERELNDPRLQSGHPLAGARTPEPHVRQEVAKPPKPFRSP